MFGLVYAVGAMTAMYITYTPVGMVRIVGLQTRYFLPVWLLAVLAAAALARRALAPRLTAEKAAAISVRLCGWYAFAGQRSCSSTTLWGRCIRFISKEKASPLGGEAVTEGD